MQNKIFRRSQAGFSIIELLIVLVVIAIIVTLAVIGLGASSSSLARQNIAREFKVALERARYDSVKRRPDTCDDMSRVEILSATSFRLLTDSNRNGTIEPAAETSNFDYSNRSTTEIVESLTYPVTIRFDGRGNTSSGPCSAPTAAHSTTTFCEMPCTTATANPENATVVYVSPTGTTTTLLGGETVPNFDEPSVTPITPSLYINPLLSVWNAITGSPSPSPSPSVSPDPSPSVSPDPSVSPSVSPDPSVSPSVSPDPSVSPSASPTATPLPFCSLTPPYDRPGFPATCTCQYPMLVAHNGKCQP